MCGAGSHISLVNQMLVKMGSVADEVLEEKIYVIVLANRYYAYRYMDNIVRRL